MKPCIKTYRVILDGDDKAITCFVPATSEQDARQWIEGNGEIIQCKELQRMRQQTGLRQDGTEQSRPGRPLQRRREELGFVVKPLFWRDCLSFCHSPNHGLR